MTEPSEMSILRPAPIPIPGSTKGSRGCFPRKGKQNQQDGNIGLDVKDAAFLNTSSEPDGIVNITIEDSPVLSSHHFTMTEDSLPEDCQLSNLESGSFSINEEYLSDLECSPERLRCTGLSPDFVRVPNEMNSPVVAKIICPSRVDLEAELKEAMETYLPLPNIKPETDSSPAKRVLEIVKHAGEGPQISSAESFSRTRSSLASLDGHSAPPHSFYIEKPCSHLGSGFVDVEEYLTNLSDSFSPPTYPALDSSATTEDFGFRPSCEHMPGLWPSLVCPKDEEPNSRRGWDLPPNTIRLLTDSRSPPGFIMSKEDALKDLEQELPPHKDTSLSFWRCRPITGTVRNGSLLSSSPPPSPTCSGDTTTLHLRGGSGEARFSLFRPIGRGKLVGNVERGKKLLDEPVSGSYMIGCWGRNETWREFSVKMEKRVEKRKAIEKLETELERLKAEKEAEGGVGLVEEALTNVKGWFSSGKGGEQREEKTEEVVVVVAAK